MEISEIIKQMKQEIAEKQRAVAKLEREQKEESEPGFFDDVVTHSEAIAKLKEIVGECDYSCKFVEIDGDIYLDLCMDNVDDWSFSKGKQLLSNKHLNKTGRRYELK